MIGFYMKCNTGPKWITQYHTNATLNTIIFAAGYWKSLKQKGGRIVIKINCFMTEDPTYRPYI